MPHHSTDYTSTVIYKIVCNDDSVKDVYVGHTTDFTNRKHQHKRTCKDESMNKKKIYTIINANGGWDNWTMIEIEKYACNDANEARAREHYWTQQLNPTMNMYAPCFISFQNSESTAHIVGLDKKHTNHLKTAFRQKQEKLELQHLRKENADLKALLKSNNIDF